MKNYFRKLSYKLIKSLADILELYDPWIQLYHWRTNVSNVYLKKILWMRFTCKTFFVQINWSLNNDFNTSLNRLDWNSYEATTVMNNYRKNISSFIFVGKRKSIRKKSKMISLIEVYAYWLSFAIRYYKNVIIKFFLNIIKQLLLIFS